MALLLRGVDIHRAAWLSSALCLHILRLSSGSSPAAKMLRAALMSALAQGPQVVQTTQPYRDSLVLLIESKEISQTLTASTCPGQLSRLGGGADP